MFYVLLPVDIPRADLIALMRADGVNPTFHYVPLHSAPGAVKLADRYQPCPVTDDIAGRLLRLPFYNDLTESDIERVVASLTHAITGVLATAAAS